MIFSPEAIANKNGYLDSIEAVPSLLESVVADYVDEPFEINRLPRLWEPGGGASLFSIGLLSRRYFLKVKHKSVFVESRLESEPNFIVKPSLENEAFFLTKLEVEWVPKVFFYEERDGYCFLALEWLEPFSDAVISMSVGEITHLWEKLVSCTKDLFVKGIVHTDLHEGNICFRHGQLVICDFEEARYFQQTCSFEQSLDYCGRNQYGDVGMFPSETGKGIAGLTCLTRLHDVFASIIRQKLIEHLKVCRFDHGCPFNLDALQEEDSRVYQSINVAGLTITGQRPLQDTRTNVLRYFVIREWQRLGRAIMHVDLGSNLGSFCFVAAGYSCVAESLGLEAFDSYVEAAQALCFLGGFTNVRFNRFVCGENILSEYVDEYLDICTMLSVYHHIANREKFLEELSRRKPKTLLAELATQDRYYPERGNVTSEIDYIKSKLGYRYAEVLLYSQDYQRPLVLFSDEKLTWLDRIFMKASHSTWFHPLLSIFYRCGRGRFLLRSLTGLGSR